MKGGTKPRLGSRAENVFFEAHSHIRDIDGMMADESLDELCKVIFLKHYCETDPGAAGRLHREKPGTAEELAVALGDIYREAVGRLSEGGSEASAPRLVSGAFSTGIKLSGPALVRVFRALEPYSLHNSGADLKGRAFQRVIAPLMRAGMGQYFTPDPVIRFVVRVIDPQPDETVVDPFCGSAHFLSAALGHTRKKLGGNSKSVAGYASQRLLGIEKSDRMARLAWAGVRLTEDLEIPIICADALLDWSSYARLEPSSVDVIVTNPPFGSLLGKEALSRLGRFELAAGRTSVPLEVLGLERSIQLLLPGGRLGIVVPDGILANEKTRAVRTWLSARAKVRAIVSLPQETFAALGANVKTSILFVRKWRRAEQPSTDYPVFLGRADGIGLEASGRPTSDNCLDDIADELVGFLSDEGW